MSEEIKSGETTNFEESFEEMLEESLKNLNTNERVMGTVISIAPNEVQVDVGRKQTGFIPVSELSNDPNVKPEDVVKIGDEIELLIMKTNDQEGTIMLSKRRYDNIANWDKIVEASENGTVLEGKVTVVYGNKSVVCKKGEAFYFITSKDHYLKNNTNKPAKIIWVSSPPNF